LENLFDRNRYSLLLLFTLLLIGVMPVIEDYFDVRIIVCITLSLFSVSGIYAIIKKRSVLILGIILTIPFLLFIWLSFIYQLFIVQLLYYITGIIFLAFLAIYFFISIFSAKTVTKNVIHGAVLVYLQIGLCWSYIYGLIEFLHPGSFTHLAPTLKYGHQPFIYFSFVTLTTLGFGDITPLTTLARSLVVLEAIIGQTYLIIQVSWLVGLYVARIHEQRKS
jgi:voltage-gated potassium channel